jgi:hypothetical protein
MPLNKLDIEPKTPEFSVSIIQLFHYIHCPWLKNTHFFVVMTLYLYFTVYNNGQDTLNP